MICLVHVLTSLKLWGLVSIFDENFNTPRPIRYRYTLDFNIFHEKSHHRSTVLAYSDIVIHDERGRLLLADSPCPSRARQIIH
jgi:hypothetical protein